jgi:hypothetical protein
MNANGLVVLFDVNVNGMLFTMLAGDARAYSTSLHCAPTPAIHMF